MTAHRYEYAYPVPLTGDAATVFEALTEPDALRAWFAEHVDVNAVEGGPFRFWGRHTYGTPGPDRANQTVLAIEPDRMLRFSWHLLGLDSTVTWTVADDDNGTSKITVAHEFPALPEMTRAAELIDDLWRIHTGNLCFYLLGKDDLFRPDFHDDSPDVRCEITIDAPPENVFAALIEPDFIKQWFPAPAPVVDPRVGGDYGFGFSFEIDGRMIEPPPMKILELEPNKRLTITWPDWRMNPDVPDQQVTWELEDLGGRTRLVLTHSGFTRTVDVSDYPFGWQDFLDKIRGVAESLAD